MTTQELIKKAIEKLNKVKQLNLTEAGILEQLGKDGTFAVSIIDNENDCTFDTIIDEQLTTQQLLPDDPTNLSCDDIILLRIAKHIFEAYKKFKDNLVNDSLTYDSGKHTISSIKLGSATYDIGVNGRSLTATFSDVDDLKDQVDKLKTEKEDLENQLKSLQSVVDLLLNRCQDKGIL